MSQTDCAQSSSLGDFLASRKKSSAKSSPFRQSADWTQILKESMHPSASHVFQVDFRNLPRVLSAMIPFEEQSSNQPLPEVETVLALSGVNIREAIMGILERRYLIPDRIALFLEHSQTPIPWETDTTFLAGRTLIVRTRSSEHHGRNSIAIGSFDKPFSPTRSRDPKECLKSGLDGRKPSLSLVIGKPKNRPQKIDMTEISNEKSDCDTGSPMPVSGDSRKVGRTSGGGRSLSTIFPASFKTEKFEFTSILDRYERGGMPSIGAIFSGSEMDLPVLYDELTDLIGSPQPFERKQLEQQEALWELICTEHNYLKELRTLVQMLVCLLDLQNQGFLLDVDPEIVFGNIHEVLTANVQFWENTVTPVLFDARQNSLADNSKENPSTHLLDPNKLELGFMQCEEIFQPYVKYCILAQGPQVPYVRKKQRESELFNEFCSWVQSQKTFGRLQLVDLLVKPVQRLTKYSLLLKAVLHRTVDSCKQATLTNLVEKMEDFVSSVNFELRYKQHHDALCQIMANIESYDVTEPVNEEMEKVMRPFCALDLTTSMIGCHPKLLRNLLLHGDLKMKDCYAKMDVHCYLLTDMFLVCKLVGKRGDRPKVRVIRPPYHIENIRVHELRDSNGFLFLVVNEFGVLSTAFTMQAPNAPDNIKWLEHFRMAKDCYRKYRDHPHNVWPPLGGPFDNLGSNRRPSQRGSVPNSKLSIRQATEPQRRISIGAMESAKRNTLDVDVNHGRSNSMDSTVLAAQSDWLMTEPSMGARDAASCSNLKAELETPDAHLGHSGVDRSASSPRSRTSISSIRKRFSSRSRRERNQDKEKNRALELRCNSPPSSYNSSPNHSPCPSPSPDYSTPVFDTNPCEISGEPVTPTSTTPVGDIIVSAPSEDRGDGEEVQISPAPPTPTPSSCSRAGTPQNEVLPSSQCSSCSSPPVEVNSPDGNRPTPTSNRRLQRRYYTADAIEDIRPSRPNRLPPAIKKRFSWNVTNASNNKLLSGPISELATAEKLLKEQSDVCTCRISTDSFGTNSSSGISSSSSRICTSPSGGECPPESLLQDLLSEGEDPGNVFENCPSIVESEACSNVSTIIIEDNESVSSMKSHQRTTTAVKNGTSIDRCSLSAEPQDIPTIEMQGPTPISTPSTPIKENDFEYLEDFLLKNNKEITAKVQQSTTTTTTTTTVNHSSRKDGPTPVSKDELLRMILENKLEASDV